MDFEFSEDQQSLRDAVRRWVDKGYDFERRRDENCPFEPGQKPAPNGKTA